MILRPVRPHVAVGTADEELAGRVDVPDGVLADPAGGQRLADVRLDDVAHLLRGEILDDVLVGDDDLRHADRLAVFVAHGDLALGVGTELGGVADLTFASAEPGRAGSCGCSRSGPA